MMKRKEIVRSALGIASVFILTAFISFPIGTFGYINIGDAMIMMFSTVVSPFNAFLVGAIGSSLADLMLAPQYVLFTFVIKGMEALIICVLYNKFPSKLKKISFILGGIWVIMGYAISDVILTGEPLMAITSIGFNSVQVIICMVIASIGIVFFEKIKKA